MVNELGKPVSRSNFHHLIRNELYTGWIEKFGERHKGNFEPIVSEGLFQHVQQLYSGKFSKNKRYIINRPEFPLRKFFKHPSGEMLTGGWCRGRNKKYPYYLFHKVKISIRKENLENLFKGWLNQFKMDISHFETLKSFVKCNLDKGIDDKKIEVERLKNRIPELKSKQAVLLEKNIEGIISNQLCRERIADLDNEIYQINKAIESRLGGSTNFTSIVSKIRDLMLNPGEVWEKAGFNEKIKLQWFYFPQGIEFDGIESRTTKICKLFKLVEQISPLISQVVDYRNTKLNTSNLQISLPSADNVSDDLFFEELSNEIVFLSELFKTDRISEDILT